jgi:hypothetical protein
MLSAASVAIDILKALAPFWLCEAWRGAQIGRALVALIVLVLCITISLASAVGFLAETYSASVGKRDALNERYEAAKARLDDLKARLTQVSKARAVGLVEAAIAAGHHDRRWASSDGCTKDTRRSSREFCQKQVALEGELNAARDAVGLRAKIVNAVKGVEALKADGGGQDKDSRGSLIAGFTGLSPASVNYGLELSLALLVESSAAFGLFLALESGKKPGSAPIARTMPDDLDLEVVQGGRRKGRKSAGQGAVAARRIRFGDKPNDLRN